MEKELKFRAKTEQGEGGWFYWDLLSMIGPNDIREDIIRETVGQFIGLKDKEGIDIYSGDVVECFIKDEEGEFTETFIVQWVNDLSAYYLISEDENVSPDLLHAIGHDVLKIVGDIY